MIVTDGCHRDDVCVYLNQQQRTVKHFEQSFLFLLLSFPLIMKKKKKVLIAYRFNIKKFVF